MLRHKQKLFFEICSYFKIPKRAGLELITDDPGNPNLLILDQFAIHYNLPAELSHYPIFCSSLNWMNLKISEMTEIEKFRKSEVYSQWMEVRSYRTKKMILSFAIHDNYFIMQGAEGYAGLGGFFFQDQFQGFCFEPVSNWLKTIYTPSD